MPADFLERCEILEECYEFTLGYAGQGLPSDQGSEAGGQVRHFLRRAADALRGLGASCAQSVRDEGLDPAETYQAFISVLDRDAGDALAAIELVLAQPAIGSQLIDNLNASLHLRALLTDLFLMGEVLRERRKTKPAVHRESTTQR